MYLTRRLCYTRIIRLQLQIGVVLASLGTPTMKLINKQISNTNRNTQAQYFIIFFLCVFSHLVVSENSASFLLIGSNDIKKEKKNKIVLRHQKYVVRVVCIIFPNLLNIYLMSFDRLHF